MIKDIVFRCMTIVVMSIILTAAYLWLLSSVPGDVQDEPVSYYPYKVENKLYFNQGKKRYNTLKYEKEVQDEVKRINI